MRRGLVGEACFGGEEVMTTKTISLEFGEGTCAMAVSKCVQTARAKATCESLPSPFLFSHVLKASRVLQDEMLVLTVSTSRWAREVGRYTQPLGLLHSTSHATSSLNAHFLKPSSRPTLTFHLQADCTQTLRPPRRPWHHTGRI